MEARPEPSAGEIKAYQDALRQEKGALLRVAEAVALRSAQAEGRISFSTWNAMRCAAASSGSLEAEAWRESARVMSDALARIATRSLWVVERVISRAGRPDLSDDLYGEGILALARAAECFRPEEGTRFSSYAMFWLKTALQEVFEAQQVVRVPASAKQVRRRWEALEAEYNQSGELSPESWEAAEELGVREDLLVKTAAQVVSLDAPASGSEEEGLNLGEVLYFESPGSVVEYDVKSLCARLLRALSDLQPEKRAAALLRFPMSFGSSPEGRLRPIGEAYRMYRERLWRRAWEILREEMPEACAGSAQLADARTV